VFLKFCSIFMKIFFCIFLSIVSYANAAIIFSDDFNDGNMLGWTGSGYSASSWQASGGMLKFNGGSYSGVIAFCGIDAITTPSNFTMDADIKIAPADSNYGHVGFFWGYQDTSNFNTAYLRTHSDHVTNWSMVGGAQSSESYLNIPGAANNSWYHMHIEVNYATKVMLLEFAGYSTTFTGSTFDLINRNTGGKMGVITAGEVGYFDNVVISIIPEPGTWILCLAALAGIFISKMRK